MSSSSYFVHKMIGSKYLEQQVKIVLASIDSMRTTSVDNHSKAVNKNVMCTRHCDIFPLTCSAEMAACAASEYVIEGCALIFFSRAVVASVSFTPTLVACNTHAYMGRAHEAHGSQDSR